jgi:hypothetical protein
MVYEIDPAGAEKGGFSCKMIIADRITIYVKHFSSKPTRYFSGDKDGVIQKEITKAELDVWLNILADTDSEVTEMQQKLSLGKKF